MSKLLLSVMGALLVAGSAVAAQCAAITQDGTQCKREAEAGSKYCWQHKAGTTAKGTNTVSKVKGTNTVNKVKGKTNKKAGVRKNAKQANAAKQAAGATK
jgi:hypothetical protein